MNKKNIIHIHGFKEKCRALSYTLQSDRSLELYDLVDFFSLENGGGKLDHISEIILDESEFLFLENGQKTCAISTIIKEPTLPLTLSPPQPVLRQDITLQFIGGSDGFDPEGITTCFLAYLGKTGRDCATLFDAAAYLRVRLWNLGISASQISEVFISHIHEDHIAGLIELLLSGGRIRLITAPIIYRSLLRVLSAMLAVPEEEAASLFDYFPLQPGQPLLLGGKYFDAIYAIHTIPTLAVRVDGLCYSGDMRYDEKWFNQLVQDGILSESRRAELIEFSEGATILVQDAGGGDIHTTPTPEVISTLAAKSKHIILTHTRINQYNIPETVKGWQKVEYISGGDLDNPSKQLPVDQKVEKLETISICPLYARLSIAGRMSLANSVEIMQFETDEIIMQQGDIPNGKAYIVHKGLVKSCIDENLVQVLGRGHSIGERETLNLEKSCRNHLIIWTNANVSHRPKNF